MGNNLERRIIVLGGTPEILDLISQFGGEVLEFKISADHGLLGADQRLVSATPSAGSESKSGFASGSMFDSNSDSISTAAALSCDAVLLNEVSPASAPAGSPARESLKKLLENFHHDAKPIAAIGESILLVAELLPNRSLEVAIRKNESPSKTKASVENEIRSEKFRKILVDTGALLTPCPSDDYISDRLNKTLTTLGSMANENSSSAEIGVQRLLRELVEMA